MYLLPCNSDAVMYYARTLSKSGSMESLEFRKFRIFSCWGAERTLCALNTGWERLEGKGVGKQGKQMENKSL